MDSRNPVTLGEIMHRQRREAVKGFAIFMAVALYGVVLIYTGVHNFHLISKTVAEDQRMFAITAVLALEGAAIFLPLAIHFWLAPGSQRMVGYLLYAVNFTIVIANTILDAILNQSKVIPDWLNLYGTYIMPATPILIGIGVAFMFILDPAKEIHDAEMAARSAHTKLFAIRMREAGNSSAVNDTVSAQAEQAVHKMIGVNHNSEAGEVTIPGATAPGDPVFNVMSVSDRKASAPGKLQPHQLPPMYTTNGKDDVDGANDDDGVEGQGGHPNAR